MMSILEESCFLCYYWIVNSSSKDTNTQRQGDREKIVEMVSLGLKNAFSCPITNPLQLQSMSLKISLTTLKHYESNIIYMLFPSLV